VEGLGWELRGEDCDRGIVSRMTYCCYGLRSSCRIAYTYHVCEGGRCSLVDNHTYWLFDCQGAKHGGRDKEYLGAD
jgi:hypothetical protein